MEKLRLPVESLQVERFDAGEAEDEPGTVDARQGQCTRAHTTCPDVTTVMTGVCHNC